MRYRCTIHNITFDLKCEDSAPPDLKEACQFMECPLCSREKNKRLFGELQKTEQHRNALLRAIEIKQEYLVTKT